MKIVYAIRHVGMTGGVKVFFQHVELLRKRGHEVFLIARYIDETWGFRVTPDIVPSFDDKYIPKADAIVVTTPKDVEVLWKIAQKRNIPLFHFMQGFEPDYVLERIHGKVIPDKFRRGGIAVRIKYLKKILGWKRKLKRFDALYRIPTIKMAISPHLVQAVANRYGMDCYLLPNGIDPSIFYPKEKELDYKDTLKILSVGNATIEYKAIPDIWKAVEILKKRGEGVFLTRVSPADIPEVEKNTGVVDRFFVRISEQEMANLYRQTHILISASTEIEGFGLPPVEAMGTGTPVILTRVSPFLAFDKIHDYAYFVNVHKPEEIAEGVIAIAQDKQLRDRLISRGYDIARKYSLEMVGQKLENILQSHIPR